MRPATGPVESRCRLSRKISVRGGRRGWGEQHERVRPGQGAQCSGGNATARYADEPLGPWPPAGSACQRGLLRRSACQRGNRPTNASSFFYLLVLRFIRLLLLLVRLGEEVSRADLPVGRLAASAIPHKDERLALGPGSRLIVPGPFIDDIPVGSSRTQNGRRCSYDETHAPEHIPCPYPFRTGPLPFWPPLRLSMEGRVSSPVAAMQSFHK